MLAIIEAVEASTLPAICDDIAAALELARSAAEVLGVRERASVVYDAAKRAARFAASERLRQEAHRIQGRALLLHHASNIRLADEYDAGQKGGDIRTRADNQLVPKGNKLSSDDLGGAPFRKLIHEARQERDAERAVPGIAEKTVLQLLEEGHEPTRTAVREACFDAAMRALKGGNGEARGSKRNPHYQPNPLRDALLSVKSACDEIAKRCSGEFTPPELLSAIYDDAERGRIAASVARAVAYLQTFHRELDR